MGIKQRTDQATESISWPAWSHGSSDLQVVQLELARLGETRGANQSASASDAAATGAEVDGAALPGELAGGHKVRVQPRDVPHVVQGDALRAHRPTAVDLQRHRLSVGAPRDHDDLGAIVAVVHGHVAAGEQKALVARHMMRRGTGDAPGRLKRSAFDRTVCIVLIYYTVRFTGDSSRKKPKLRHRIHIYIISYDHVIVM